MKSLVEKLKRKANPKNARAMKILENRGFRFLVHFGTQNAAEILRDMNRAKRQGRLYEFLNRNLGVNR